MTSIEQILSRLEHHGARLERKPEGGVRVKAPSPLPEDLLEVIRANKTALIEHVTAGEAHLFGASKYTNMGTERPEPRDTGTSARNPPGSLERLPFELEALVRAATNDSLPKSATLETGIVPDLNRWVLAWTAAHVLRSPDALEHLWMAHAQWQTHFERILN